MRVHRAGRGQALSRSPKIAEVGHAEALLGPLRRRADRSRDGAVVLQLAHRSTRALRNASDAIIAAIA